MPLHIAPIDSKESARAAERACHSPLRFIVWVSPNNPDFVSDFVHPPYPEEELQQVASAIPELPHLELVVLEDGGRIVGYLGHPNEYRTRPRMHRTRTLRAVIMSASNELLPHLQRSLKPGVLERIAESFKRRSRRIKRAMEQLHAREEAIASMAHFVVPLLTPPNDDVDLTSRTSSPGHVAGANLHRRQFGDLDL